jgi:hypothetical protein
MPITWKEKTLSMAWCLDCHRHPENALRPREHVYDLAWQPKEGQDQATLGKQLIKQYKVMNNFQLTNCSTCHR